MPTPAAIWTALWAFVLVATARWHGGLSLDQQAIQGPGSRKLHDHPAPRIGGLALMGGLVMEWLWGAPGSASLLGPLLACGLPAFVAGTGEDLTRRVSVRARLLATVGSGALAALVTGVALQRTEVPLLDAALQWWPLAVVVTAVAVGGVANALNIIDGCHGLAAGMALLAFAAYGTMAAAQGDAVLAGLCAAWASALLGFLVFNWPWGRLFLGDGGAYLMGFALAWIAVLLITRHPTISPFAVLLVCIHPVTEVLFSMVRRRLRQNSPSDRDNLHLHSLFMRRVARRWWPARWRNAGTGLVMALITVPVAWAAVVLAEQAMGAALACAVAVAIYSAMYAWVARDPADGSGLN